MIGTLALQGQAAGLDVLMVTPDKDYAQLVRPGITMCRPSSGKSGLEKLDVEAVCEKYGLAHPTQVIDMLALMGDAADNIPGAPASDRKRPSSSWPNLRMSNNSSRTSNNSKVRYDKK